MSMMMDLTECVQGSHLNSQVYTHLVLKFTSKRDNGNENILARIEWILAYSQVIPRDLKIILGYSVVLIPSVW